jgi:Tfp pilus assembly protein PilN
LFIILLINFILFSYQSDKQKQLAGELNQYQETIQQLASYKEEIAEKEKITQNGAWGENSYFSYYADRIAASKPDGILLQKMQLFPVTLKNKKFDLNGIRKDTICIEGVTQNSVLLNEWTKALQSQEFVKHVGITNYTQQESSSGSFTLQIALNPKKE